MRKSNKNMRKRKIKKRNITLKNNYTDEAKRILKAINDLKKNNKTKKNK